ncbi:MAG: ATP-binding protein [Myxococcota bacterium]
MSENRYLAHRRFAVTFALMITTTGLVAFLIASLFVRPLMASFFRPHVAKTVIMPAIVDAVERTTGEEFKDVEITVTGDTTTIRGTSAGKSFALGPYELPPPPFWVGFSIISILCCVIGIASSLIFALPWTRRLQRVADAFDTVASGRMRTRIPVETEDIVAQISKGFNAMAERIEGTLREREQLLQAVSHELSTPVTRIRLLLSLERVQKEPALLAELEELEALVDELVTYVELESAPAPRSYRDIDIAASANEILESHREWSQHDITLNVSSEAMEFGADERDVRRTLSNLLRNAERYARGQITISIDHADGALRMDVEDDGPGIDPSRWRSIFLPFAREDESRNRATGGVGLGLALVDRIARRYNGEARAEKSDRLGGARFIVVWHVSSAKP